MINIQKTTRILTPFFKLEIRAGSPFINCHSPPFKLLSLYTRNFFELIA